MGSARKSAYWSEIKALVLISSRIKANFQIFPIIMEVPLDFGQNKISLNDIVAMELIFGYLNVHKLNVL